MLQPPGPGRKLWGLKDKMTRATGAGMCTFFPLRTFWGLTNDLLSDGYIAVESGCESISGLRSPTLKFIDVRWSYHSIGRALVKHMF